MFDQFCPRWVGLHKRGCVIETQRWFKGFEPDMIAAPLFFQSSQLRGENIRGGTHGENKGSEKSQQSELPNTLRRVRRGEGEGSSHRGRGGQGEDKIAGKKKAVAGRDSTGQFD